MQDNPIAPFSKARQHVQEDMAPQCYMGEEPGPHSGVDLRTQYILKIPETVTAGGISTDPYSGHRKILPKTTVITLEHEQIVGVLRNTQDSHGPPISRVSSPHPQA